MPAKSKKQRSVLKKRIHTLEADLASLQPGQHAYHSAKHMLEQQIQLAKAELNPPKRSSSRKSSKSSKSSSKKSSTSSSGSKSAANSGTTTTPQKKKSPLPGGASFPSFQLPNPKSPTFYEDSLKTVGSLRNLCKQAMGYIQRADQLFDGLHGVGSQLHQSGVLPKILGGKFRDMNTSEWGALLMALMQSPLSGYLLGGGGEQGEQPALPAGEQHADHGTEQHADANAASHS